MTETETGCITLTILDVDEEPIKNASILLSDGSHMYTGRTDRNGEATLTDVLYGSYELNISRTGYDSIIETHFTVDDQVTTASYTMTRHDPDNGLVELDLDEVYTLQVTGKTSPNYRISATISQWLKTNIESLTDDQGNTIFSKVNLGFDENGLKGFGNRPVCDVYINQFEYSTDFDMHKPEKVHSIIIFYIKGANNQSFLQCCQVHDYLMQEFVENQVFRRLTDVVYDTYITNSELMNQPINTKWGVMGALELSHDLY